MQPRSGGAAAREVGLDDGQQQLLQHEVEALGRDEAVVQHFDRERVGEAPDARGDGLVRLGKGLRGGIEHRREAGAQPVGGRVQRQHARRRGRGMAFAGVEEHQVGVARLHEDHRVGLGGARLAGREITQHQAAEPSLQDPNQSPHAG